MADLTPEQLIEAYTNGFPGMIRDYAHEEEFLASLENPDFRYAAPNLTGTGKGKLSLPFMSVLEFDPNAYEERQTTGDCTVKSTLVRLADGTEKPIEEVQIGEYVLSHKRIARKVTNTIQKKYTGKLVTIYIDGHDKTLTSTERHPIIGLVKITGMEEREIPVGDLKVGDNVLIPFANKELAKEFRYNTVDNGTPLPIINLTYEDVVDFDVYCLEVEVEHTFIANGFAKKNCVSHGTRNAVDVSRAIQIVNGAPEGWLHRGATECIYGARGHGGQGMDPSRAAKFVNQDGGIAIRMKYPSVDLSIYNANIGANWGGRGVPRDLLEILQKNKVGTLTRINSAEEAADALANGYGVSVGSDVGFSSSRDNKGFSRRSGSWNHQMSFTAANNTDGEFALLCQNSWGAFNSGPKAHGQPDGSFWVHEDDANVMIKQGGTYAYSMLTGFPPQALPDYGTGSFF